MTRLWLHYESLVTPYRRCRYYTLVRKELHFGGIPTGKSFQRTSFWFDVLVQTKHQTKIVRMFGMSGIQRSNFIVSPYFNSTGGAVRERSVSVNMRIFLALPSRITDQVSFDLLPCLGRGRVVDIHPHLRNIAVTNFNRCPVSTGLARIAVLNLKDVTPFSCRPHLIAGPYPLCEGNPDRLS